ncbi:pyridoxal-dependent decarboxylase [Nocardioides mangrovicus]|uniref:Pyridoxal-dependent decarboxylase n=1 Tax=Nocardioides mangrovicus TaxID=2478913 RepID=A0A3L8P4L6_9ACTN|nr:aspartate aminotransferase family protein [Nocardioides mangrovicus]RLV50290.1 pyridoxal-dependent decarboxylase [Nocardioides mangrovicus]
MLGTSAPPSGLLDAEGAQEYAQLSTQAAALVARHLAQAPTPFSGTTPASSRRRVERVDLDRPLGRPEEVLAEVERLYLRDAVWFHHPGYAAHLNCPVATSAVVADQLASAVNTSMDTWDQSGTATTMERHLLSWTAGRLGLPARADGVFTSGGTASNTHALAVARGHALETVGGRLPHDLHRLRVLATADGHFSVHTATHLLGLGDDAVVEVATDERHRMDPDALVAELVRLETAGLVPMALVATAGTTDLGAVDPLARIAQVCRAFGVWLHVDAAYGGGLMTSLRRRHLLDGIERADSVTVDFHKTFFQPVASSAVLVRDAASMRHVRHHAAYLNPADEGPDAVPNQVDKSLQTTRRFDALKLWCTLRTLGADGVGAMLDAVCDLASEVARVIADDRDLELYQRPQLSTVVFRYAPDWLDEDALDEVNRQARRALVASGRAMVALTEIDGRAYLKLTLLNPATTVADLAAVLDLVREHASAAGDCWVDERQAG